MVIGIPTFESFQRTYQSSFHDNQGSLLVSAIPFVKRTKGTGWKPVRQFCDYRSPQQDL